MDSGSILIENTIKLINGNKSFSSERSQSMTVLSQKSTSASSTNSGQPRMAQLETLEAKMASIEVSLSSATPRRRKVSSLGGSISSRTSPRPETVPSRELRSALQDREAVIQSLRMQLGLGKLPRPIGTPLEDSEKPAAEQRLGRLKIEADNKRTAIRNLKSALDKLDITDNIDVRIRQAELEYALGREELQLLSIVEEARALQARLEKSKPEANTLFSILQAGINLSLIAVHATVGRFAASPKNGCPGLWIEWALDGEGLCRGDKILEVNGKIITIKSREELQKILGSTGKCQLVVIRKRSAANMPQQQLLQSREDNQRLQHRISYLEDQVKELQTSKDAPPLPTSSPPMMNGHHGGHVTNISISSPPVTPPDKPQIYQRGSFVTTIVGGKPIDKPPCSAMKQIISNHITKTLISDVDESDTNDKSSRLHHNGKHHHINNNNNNNNNNNHVKHNNYHNDSISASMISISSDIAASQKRERDRIIQQKQQQKELRREEKERIYQQQQQHHYYRNQQQHGIYHSNNNHHSSNNVAEKKTIKNNSHDSHHYNGNTNNQHARSVEHLNYYSNNRRKKTPEWELQRHPINDLRSVKSLDFESDGCDRLGDVDYTSEPVAPRIRPTPPKKPLRLSLQRAQSLQTVEDNFLDDKKRAMKRTHKGERTAFEQQMFQLENKIPLQTASLGRNKHI